MKDDDPPLPTADIQAIASTGFGGLRHGEYLLLRRCKPAESPAAAKGWLKRVLHLVASVNAVNQPARPRLAQVATLAFTHVGLIAFGVRPSEIYPFPSTFSDGMGHPDRSLQLGDINAPQWCWLDTPSAGDASKAVHLLVAHYWHADIDRRAGTCALFEPGQLASAGLHEVQRVRVDPTYLRADGTAVEPFGFRDGIAQPVVAGLRDSQERVFCEADDNTKAVLRTNRIKAGEFVLGQRNEYRDIAYAPDVAGWTGANRFAFGGSYIAVRQIQQHVAQFKAFERAHGTEVVEKMVGRRRDGTPMCPHDASDRESFGYRADDASGFGCPRGAHMRRGNPRDSQGHDVASGETNSRLHRLLRRGRAYRDGHTGERGLFFMALNADLDRQFAFIQQRWINNSQFGDLADETDPLLGQGPRAFTIQDPLFSKRLQGLPHFTTVIGGGYFLLPSLPALHFIAR